MVAIILYAIEKADNLISLEIQKTENSQNFFERAFK